MIETDINYNMSLEINSVVSNLSKYPSISLPWRALWDFCPSFMSNAVLGHEGRDSANQLMSHVPVHEPAK